MDAALAAGGKIVPVAQQFGLSKSTVHRHQTHCLGLQRPSRAQKAALQQSVVALRKATPKRASNGGGAPVNASGVTPTPPPPTPAGPLVPGADATPSVASTENVSTTAEPVDVISLEGLQGSWRGMILQLESATMQAVEAKSFAGLAALSNAMARTLESVAKLQGYHKEPDAKPEGPGFVINITMPEDPVPAVTAASIPVTPRREENAADVERGEPAKPPTSAGTTLTINFVDPATLKVPDFGLSPAEPTRWDQQF